MKDSGLTALAARQAVPPSGLPAVVFRAPSLALGSAFSPQPSVHLALDPRRSIDSFAPAQLNGTLRPQSGAALTGLPTAISPQLFQEFWFTLSGLPSVIPEHGDAWDSLRTSVA
jgi:hypothetical protein